MIPVRPVRREAGPSTTSLPGPWSEAPNVPPGSPGCARPMSLGVFMPIIFHLTFEFIFVLILGFRVTNLSYIPFLIGLKMSYRLVPKSTLLDKN